VGSAALRVPLAEARPSLPRSLSDAVQRAIADDPHARQESVEEFRAELIGALKRRVVAPLPDAVRGELARAA
jgi:hypothetical protein